MTCPFATFINNKTNKTMPRKGNRRVRSSVEHPGSELIRSWTWALPKGGLSLILLCIQKVAVSYTRSKSSSLTFCKEALSAP